jgi:hypothetical protein
MSVGEAKQMTIDNFNDIIPFMETGQVVPIISNAFRIEEIFRNDEELLKKMNDSPEFYDEVRTVDQQLTKQWAQKIGYPMSDDHNLARVAQYRQVETEDPDLAKFEYLKFLNDRLLKLCENEQGYKDKVSQLKTQTGRQLFSDTAQQLDFPRQYSESREDPLRILARLPIKIFITTSFFNTLERALEAEGKKPRTQICFLSSGISTVRREHLPDPDYEPTPENPAVYHFFGLEDYKDTLVLSEDDHMNFLMNAVEEINSQDIYPTPLRQALPDSRFLLLGFKLRDWDFRTVFRFILKIRPKTIKPKPSIAIQLRPNLGKKDFEEKSLNYLEHYFKGHNFRVKWTSTEKFIYELWDAWNRYRQGE